MALSYLHLSSKCLTQVDVYTPLKAILTKAWVVWELLLLAQPLMVAARSPGELAWIGSLKCLSCTDLWGACKSFKTGLFL